MYQTYGPVLDALRVRGLSASVLDDVVASAADSGKPLRDVLVAKGVVTEIELSEAVAEAYGLKTVDLTTYPIDLAAAARIPVALARRHHVFGIALDDEEIVVAVADPGDVLALDDVRAATGLLVRAGRRGSRRVEQGDRQVRPFGDRPRRCGRRRWPSTTSRRLR